MPSRLPRSKDFRVFSLNILLSASAALDDACCRSRTFLDSIVVLMDESGSIVTLSNPNHADAVAYPGAFHIGFVQQSNEDVDAVNRRLLSDGYVHGKPKVLHGSYTYVKASGGFLVEVLGPMPGLGATEPD